MVRIFIIALFVFCAGNLFAQNRDWQLVPLNQQSIYLSNTDSILYSIEMQGDSNLVQPVFQVGDKKKVCNLDLWGAQLCNNYLNDILVNKLVIEYKSKNQLQFRRFERYNDKDTTIVTVLYFYPLADSGFKWKMDYLDYEGSEVKRISIGIECMGERDSVVFGSMDRIKIFKVDSSNTPIILSKKIRLITILF